MNTSPRRFYGAAALVIASILVVGFSPHGQPGGLAGGPQVARAADPVKAVEPSQQQRAIIDGQLIPAYEAGNGPAVVDAGAKLTTRAKPEEIEGVNRYLATQNQPALGNMLLDARVGLMRAGGKFLNPRPKAAEVLLVLPAFQSRFDGLVADIHGLPVLADPPPQPADPRAYEDLFWSLTQAQQRIAQMGKIAQEVRNMAGLRLRVRRSALTQQQQDSLNTDYQKLIMELFGLYRKTRERDVEFRLQRLDLAARILRDSAVIKERLLAAHIVDSDGAILIKAFPLPSPTKVADQGAGRQKTEPKRAAKDGPARKAGAGKKIDDDKPVEPAPVAARPRYLNERLNDPELPQRIREQITESQQAAGELMAKSRHLFGGIHWWLRGRYGRGMVFYGLIKSAAAKQSKSANDWLYMPTKLPKNDKLDSTSNYDYPDRRHFYTWHYETRQVQIRSTAGPAVSLVPRGGRRPAPPRANPAPPARRTPKPKQLSFGRGRRGFRGGGRGGGIGVSGSGGGTSQSIFLTRNDVAFDRLGWSLKDLYKRKFGIDYKEPKPRSPSPGYRKPPTTARTVYSETYIPEQDPRLILQVVGFMEYAIALEHFDTLVKICNEEELKAADELIKERDELAIEVNLSRTMEQNSSLSEKPAQPGDNFIRRGLRWMTAVARAEVGAMLVGFANQADGLVRQAKQYDLEEYKELVLDGMRAHYWSLKDDANLQLVLHGQANANRTLAYFRRLLVAEGFLQAAVALCGDQFSPTQKAELTAWKQQIDQMQAVLAKRIADYHRSKTEVQVN